MWKTWTHVSYQMTNNCRQNLQALCSNRGAKRQALFTDTFYCLLLWANLVWDQEACVVHRWCNTFAANDKLFQKSPPSVKAVVWPVVQQNAYWPHPEKVLLAMLMDADHNCETAIDIIKNIRLNSAVHTPHIREFQIPRISQNAHLKDLLPAVQELRMEPPMKEHLPAEQVDNFAENPLFFAFLVILKVLNGALNWLQKLLELCTGKTLKMTS